MIRTLFQRFSASFIKKEVSPVSTTEFSEWVDQVIALTRLPNNESTRFAVCAIVLEAKDKLTKQQAAERLEKGATNQFAAHFFQEIKTKQMDKMAQKQSEPSHVEEAQSSQQPEATSHELAGSTVSST